MMLTFKSYLVESQEINLSMKAYNTLSYKAQEAIDGWESYSWHTGELTKAFKEKNEIYHEIYDAFTPVRDYLFRKYGKSITLYRGEYLDHPPHPNKALESWSSDKRVASHFAGLNDYRYTNKKDKPGSWRSYLSNVLSDKQIDEIVANFKKRGYAQDDRYHYIISKEDPKYYNIYYLKSRKFVTDGYTKDFEQDLRDTAKENAELNDSKIAKSKVMKKDIPIKDILWISNRLGSKEYIVKF